MFTPDPNNNTHSLRPKRTRPNASNDESIKLPQAKRRRSALKKDTFEPLAEASVNEIAGRQNGGLKVNGHVPGEKAISTNAPAPLKELTLRGGKKPDKRSERASNALTLASNDFYNVVQLPALPEQIRNRPAVPYTCVLSTEHGYALALTHTEALIWPYNSSASSPTAREVISFKLPLPPASAADPLPLAAFTARSASGEPGLVIVAPKWGKVIYWETITHASTTIPGQAANGVHGSIPGMLSGETVQEISNAEPSGFILSFSHGRAAHLSVRDQLGRPAIGVQFLRKSANASAGGIFGSIRSVFGGDRRKGTPMTRAGAASKGRRTVVVLTENGESEVWDTTAAGSHSLEFSQSSKDAMLEALSSQVQAERTPQHLPFKVLDFELMPPSQQLARQDQPSIVSMYILASFSMDGGSQYYIIEMSVSSSETTVDVVHPIKCYSAPLSQSSSWRPRLSVTNSHQVACIIFETSIVLFSLARVRESPSSQLLMEKQALPDPFQDCVSFQEDAIYKVLGFAAEDRDRNATCILGVQAFGLMRVQIPIRDSDEVDVEDLAERITAKSKLEQAVFFGTIKQNPLDLNKSSLSSFPAKEIEDAALAISTEIITSTTKYLPRSAPSTDMQMKLRAKALDDLIQHLMKICPSSVSRHMRIQLLWNAEKLAAAQAVWKVQEDIQRRYPLEDREMPYLDFVLRALHDSRQKYPEMDKGQTDRVRHWLLNSVDNADHLMSEIVDCIGELEPMFVTNPIVVGEYLREAVDLWCAAYSAAFKFREDNAPLYGLGDEVYHDGVMVAGYPVDLRDPWTSRKEPLMFGQRLIYDVCKFLNEWWNYSSDDKKAMPTDEAGNPYPAPPRSLLNDLASRLAREVELFNRIVKEEIIQAIQKAEVTYIDDPKKREAEVASIQRERRPRLYQAIQAISKYNMEGAIKLAEQFEDTWQLVLLTADYLRMLTLDTETHPENAPKNRKKIGEIQDRAESYYDRFGEGWAFAHFRRKIEQGELGSLLLEAQEQDGKKQKYLTWFLKKGQRIGQHLGKLSWINEVVGEKNFVRAEQTLTEVASNDEGSLWSQKTELSLAKLASLAAAEGSGRPASTASQYDKKLGLVEIQENITEHVSAAVGDAIDAKAAEELAMQTFASRVVKGHPASRKLLKASLQGILARQPLSPESVIDFLTLGDPIEWAGEEEDDPQVVLHEFSLALKAVQLANFSEPHKIALRQLIWRRAMIRDDWGILNNTKGKDDQTVEEEMQQSTIFRTLAQLLAEAEQEQADGRAEGNVQNQLVSPKEILEVDSVFPQVLQVRFYGDEKERGAIKKDLDKEQSKLKEYVDKAQLEMHWSGLLSNAERIVKDMVDQEGEEMAEEVLDDV